MSLLERILDSISDGVAVVDADGRLVRWNEAAAHLTGWSHEEAQSRDVTTMRDGLLDLGDGAWIDVQHVNDGDHRVVLFTDARDRIALKEAIFRLSELATTDVLTGLPNRALGLERLAQALALARREYLHVGLLLVDIDGFRDLNEQLGHVAGDSVLRQAARRLTEACRESDTAARLGGDEFLVVLASLGEPEDAEIAAQRVVEAFARPFDIGGRELAISCSIGVAVFPKDGFEADDLLRNADVAMARARALEGSTYRSVDGRPRLRLVT
jgi:diguanylate cyclase (GGDEF)-like protein